MRRRNASVGLSVPHPGTADPQGEKVIHSLFLFWLAKALEKMTVPTAIAGLHLSVIWIPYLEKGPGLLEITSHRKLFLLRFWDQSVNYIGFEIQPFILLPLVNASCGVLVSLLLFSFIVGLLQCFHRADKALALHVTVNTKFCVYPVQLAPMNTFIPLRLISYILSAF